MVSLIAPINRILYRLFFSLFVFFWGTPSFSLPVFNSPLYALLCKLLCLHCPKVSINRHILIENFGYWVVRTVSIFLWSVQIQYCVLQQQQTNNKHNYLDKWVFGAHLVSTQCLLWKQYWTKSRSLWKNSWMRKKFFRKLNHKTKSYWTCIPI